MRQLRTCDFCGDEAAGVFEVVPSELEPDPAEQRRTVLCGDCSDRLETLLEPLLARLGDLPTSAGADDADSSDTGRDAGRTTDDAAPATDASADREIGEGEGETTVADANAARPTDTSPNSGDGTSADLAEDGASEASAADAKSGANAGSSAADDSPTPPASTAAAASSADRTSGARSTADDASDGGRGSSRAPKAYGKAMRLLSNRELPMGRDEVESLIAGAYDLETHEVEAVVDHALETGRLRQDGGQLHRA